MTKLMAVVPLFALAGTLASCGQTQTPSRSEVGEAQIATLYRNSNLASNLRLHFASFDVVGEANDFNISNCQMAARLLNANIKEQSTGLNTPPVGFWCEPGPFREDGITPTTFDAEYPTDVGAKAAP